LPLDIKFSAQSSAGSVENADILRKKEAEIALMQNNVVLWSYFGTHMFKDKPNKNFRLLQPFVPNAYHFIVANNINSLLDIKGKRFVVGRAGSGSATASQAVLEALGISYDEFRPEYLGQGEGLDAVRNGVVDGILALGGYPVPAIADVMAAPKRSYKILNLTDVERKIINKVENWILPTEIPANTYLNQPEPIKTLQHVALFIVTEEMPEEVAYELAKTSWEKMDWLRKASAIFNRMKIENVDEDFINYPVPLHKGAEKYYKEIGIIK
jgi:TRAP transporter TAXI family solute receptor